MYTCFDDNTTPKKVGENKTKQHSKTKNQKLPSVLDKQN